MTFQPTRDGVRALIEAMLVDNGDVTVDAVAATPWGAIATFSLDGVAFDHTEIISNGDVLCVKALEEEFRQNHMLRIACGGEDPDANEDDEDSTLPECVMVGIHTMAETTDDDYRATYGGKIMVLAPGGDHDAWKAAAVAEQDRLMRTSIVEALELLDDMLREANDAAFAGIVKDRRFRSLMRRVAAAA